MHFLTALVSTLPVFAAFVSAVPVQPRDADQVAQIISDVSEIGGHVADLTTQVNAFEGSIFDSAAILITNIKLDLQVKVTTGHVKAATAFTSDESLQVALALAGLITPITESLTALETKYGTFKKVLQTPIVLIDLYVLRTDTNALIAALLEKVTADWVALINAGTDIISGAFNQTIVAYGGIA